MTLNNNYEKIEEEAIKKLKPQKPKMRISGKSTFLLENLSRKKNDKKISKKN